MEGEYKYALRLISSSCVEVSKLNISPNKFKENIRNYLNVLNLYCDYETKDLSDDIDFRRGKIDVNEWRIRRGFEPDDELKNKYWDLKSGRCL